MFGLFLLLLVGIMWGTTNPYMRKAGKMSTSQFVIPFVLNQLGSVLYNLALGTVSVPLALPLANALTLIFTALTSQYLGEQAISKRGAVGIVITLIGIILCTNG